MRERERERERRENERELCVCSMFQSTIFHEHWRKIDDEIL